MLIEQLSKIDKERKETIIIDDIKNYLKSYDHQEIMEIFNKNCFKQLLKHVTQVRDRAQLSFPRWNN